MFYWIYTVIVVGLLIFRFSSFYRYKRSGSLIFISSFKVQDFLFVTLWLVIGALSISNIFRYRSMLSIDGSWLIELVFWILVISLGIFTFLQRTKITQGGIHYNSYFWEWEEIISFEWTSKYTLKFNAKPKLRIFKPTITIDLWKKREQKDSVEQLIREHFPTNL